MQTRSLMRLFGRILLTLLAFLTVQLLVSIALIRRMQHDKRFRTKVFKFFNPVTLPLAGKRFSPFGLLRHAGRRSGKTYETPLRAYPFDDGFVLGLTYGPEVDWCRNVMAAGKGTLRWHGQEYELERPEIIPATLASDSPSLSFTLALTRGIVKQYLWLHRPGEVAATAQPTKVSAEVS